MLSISDVYIVIKSFKFEIPVPPRRDWNKAGIPSLGAARNELKKDIRILAFFV
jgi:hypothetical protein